MKNWEVSQLLTLAATFDNRQAAEFAVEAWYAALDPNMTFEDARRIVIEHYRHSRAFIMPADVNAGYQAMRRDRLERMGTPPLAPPSIEPGDIQGQIRWERTVRRLVGDGLTGRPLIEAACAEIGIAPPPLTPPPTRPIAELMREAKETTPGRPFRRPSSSQEEK